eukprot:6078695-Prymnesium_polylepis.1
MLLVAEELLGGLARCVREADASPSVGNCGWDLPTRVRRARVHSLCGPSAKRGRTRGPHRFLLLPPPLDYAAPLATDRL